MVEYDRQITGPSDEEKINNYLYFEYPYVLLWREDDNMWYPLPTDRFCEVEIIKMKEFVTEVYPKLSTENLSLDELAYDIKIHLKNDICSKHLDLLEKFILNAKNPEEE